MVWLLVLSSSLALYVVYLAWGHAGGKLAALKNASIIGSLVLLGFFASTLLRETYGGSLSDMKEPISVLGIDGNMASFSIAAILQLTAMIIVWRHAQPQST